MGTGAIIEPRLIDQLPVVLNPIEVLSVSDIGVTPAGQRQETTTHTIEGEYGLDQGGGHPPRMG